jgi:hypothetical protein
MEILVYLQFIALRMAVIVAVNMDKILKNLILKWYVSSINFHALLFLIML